MPTVSVLEFQRKFGRFQHEAQREPVEITRHGRREFVLMSAEQYDWLRASARRSHRTEDAADVVIDAVERAGAVRPDQGPLPRTGPCEAEPRCAPLTDGTARQAEKLRTNEPA